MRWKNSIRLRSNEAYLPERRKVEKILEGQEREMPMPQR